MDSDFFKRYNEHSGYWTFLSQYHGLFEHWHATSLLGANIIRVQGIDLTLGGGELGQGFYTGDDLEETRRWALNTHGHRAASLVVYFSRPSKLASLRPLEFTYEEAVRIDKILKLKGKGRTCTFGVDYVIAPIVGGSYRIDSQYKWESAAAVTYLQEYSERIII